ncbi:hypothetical protein, partial [Clostridium beijerinckii]
ISKKMSRYKTNYVSFATATYFFDAKFNTTKVLIPPIAEVSLTSDNRADVVLVVDNMSSTPFIYKSNNIISFSNSINWFKSSL